MEFEGHTYVSKIGNKFLVLEGSFSRWTKYLKKHHELKDGSFQCSISKKNSYKSIKKVDKGIFQIVEE